MPKVPKIKVFYLFMLISPSSLDCIRFEILIFPEARSQSFILRDGAPRHHNFSHFKF